MSDNTGKPYADGHAIYTGEGAEKTMLAEGITFVDGTNRADAAQDGSFEHPFATILQAVKNAGKNAVIFVNDGEYREEVVLLPGQTLTSEIAGFASWIPPRIRSVEKTYRHTGAAGACAEGWWHTMFAAVVTMRENTTLRRMELVSDGPVKRDEHEQLGGHLWQERRYGLTAIWAEAAEGVEDFDINVEENTLRVKRNGGDHDTDDTALWVRLKNGVTRGRVRIARNRCHAVYGMRIEDLQRYDNPASALHRIDLRENVIESVTSGISFEIQGPGDEIDCIDNVISSGWKGVAIDEFASGNMMRLHNNRIMSISDSPFRFGVYVDGRGWPTKASSATLSLRGNTIRAPRGIGILSDKTPPIFDRNQLVTDNDIQVFGKDTEPVCDF